MEKDRLLESCGKAFAVVVCALLLASCGLPRIIMLNDPLTPEEHINLGVAYERRGEEDAALEEYRAASASLPVAYLYMGNVCFGKRDFERAEKFYKEAIAGTGDARAYNNLAWLYFTIGKNLAEAEELARAAVLKSPDTGDFRDTLARIMEKRKESPAP